MDKIREILKSPRSDSENIYQEHGETGSTIMSPQCTMGQKPGMTSNNCEETPTVQCRPIYDVNFNKIGVRVADNNFLKAAEIENFSIGHGICDKHLHDTNHCGDCRDMLDLTPRVRFEQKILENANNMFWMISNTFDCGQIGASQEHLDVL